MRQEAQVKSVFFFFPLFLSLSAISAPEAIYTIEEDDFLPEAIEVSPEALPADLHAELISKSDEMGFTPMTDRDLNIVFEILKTDRKARNKMAGGNCAIRRKYIQDYLEKMTIKSGRLYVSCPSFNGKMKLRDRATNHVYSFANFHDVNIIAVNTPTGRAFRVMDVQFEDAPMTFENYLAEIEASQRIMPLKRKGDTKGLCYWTVSTPEMTFKKMIQ